MNNYDSKATGYQSAGQQSAQVDCQIFQLICYIQYSLEAIQQQYTLYARFMYGVANGKI